MQWLKQSTAVNVQMGPFVDETDGFTEEAGLTISQADIRISKNGANIIPTNNAAGATYDETGMYSVPLDTTDTNTLGRLIVIIHESGARPVMREFMVFSANVFDSLVSGSGSDYLQVDAIQIASGGAAAAINAEVVDVMETDTHVEPVAVIAATSSLKDKISWLFVLARNKIKQTAATQTLRNDADGADIATASVSDDGTTATRGEFT